MSPKKAILRELRAAGPTNYKLPSEIPGFSADAPRYREAMNELLKDRLISGGKDDEGNLVVVINEARSKDVDRALRPVPMWLVAGLILVAGASVAAALLT